MIWFTLHQHRLCHHFCWTVLISQWYKLSKNFLLVSIGYISFLHRVLRPPGGGSSFTLGGGDDPPPKATQSPAAPSPVAAAAGAPTPDKPSEQNCESYRDRLYGGGSTAEVKTKSGGNPKNMGKCSYYKHHSNVLMNKQYCDYTNGYFLFLHSFMNSDWWLDIIVLFLFTSFPLHDGVIRSDLWDWYLTAYTKVYLTSIYLTHCKTAVSPLLMHWRHCSLTISHWYIETVPARSDGTKQHKVL